MPTFNFTDNDGIDIGNKYVTKEYVMDAYPDLVPGFTSGELYTCGYNFKGQQADGTTTDRSSPGTTVSGVTTWKQISAGYQNSVAGIKSDGTLWTWGPDFNGILGAGTLNVSRSSPGTTAGGGTNWKQISVSNHSAAVKTDGTLWTWGPNTSGQLGTGNTTSRSSPGTVAGGGTNWKQASTSNSGVAAIKSDGTLWTCGYNGSGQLGDGTTTGRSSPGTTAGGGTNWKQVSCGIYASLAIKTDGTLWSWGNNFGGRLATGDTTNRSSPGTTVGGGTNWKQISCHYSAAAAIKTDGTLWTWGLNDFGQLGNGTTTSGLSPVTIAGGGTNWARVNSNYKSMAAIKTDGTLWTWGNNSNGHLGDGTTTSRSSPGTTAGGGTNWKDVSIAFKNLAAITDQGGL